MPPSISSREPRVVSINRGHAEHGSKTIFAQATFIHDQEVAGSRTRHTSELRGAGLAQIVMIIWPVSVILYGAGNFYCGYISHGFNKKQL